MGGSVEWRRHTGLGGGNPRHCRPPKLSTRADFQVSTARSSHRAVASWVAAACATSSAASERHFGRLGDSHRDCVPSTLVWGRSLPNSENPPSCRGDGGDMQQHQCDRGAGNDFIKAASCFTDSVRRREKSPGCSRNSMTAGIVASVFGGCTGNGLVAVPTHKRHCVVTCSNGCTPMAWTRCMSVA